MVIIGEGCIEYADKPDKDKGMGGWANADISWETGE